MASIKEARPELLQNIVSTAAPIDLKVPEHVTEKFATGTYTCLVIVVC